MQISPRYGDMHALKGYNRKCKYHKWQNGFGVLFAGEGIKLRFPSND